MLLRSLTLAVSCAGAAPAMRGFLSSLVDDFRHMGLEVNLDKIDIIPPCTSSQPFRAPPTSQGVAGTGLPVLRCENLLGRRVAKACALPTAIGRPPLTHMSLCPFSGSPCGAASVCPSGTATPPGARVGKFLTDGETMHSLAAEEATEFSVTTPSATSSSLRLLSSRLFPPSLKNPGLLLPPRLPDLGERGPSPNLITAWTRVPLPRAAAADVRVPRGISGFAEAWDFFSLFFAAQLVHLLGHPFGRQRVRRSRISQATASQVASLGATFCPLVLEACGGSV